MATKKYNGVEYDPVTDYQAQINEAAAAGNNAAAAQYERQRNAKIQGEGLNYGTTRQYAQYLPMQNYNGVTYDNATDYMAKMNEAANAGDYSSAAKYERQRNAKIAGEGLNYDATDYYSKYLPENRYNYDPSKNAQYQQYSDMASRLFDEIMSRPKFAYDVNEDALYQQYAEQYRNMGRLAMQDTMGQAAALTGGYGSTYSQGVGQQQYNAYLERLNDIIPELEQRAYERYADEGNNLMSQYALAQGLADDAYSKDYQNWYNRLQLEKADEDAAYNRELAADQTAYNREQDAYSKKQDAWSRLSTLITTTGYTPSDAELAAAGMSANEAAYLRQYFTMIQASSNKSGGAGGGNSGYSSRGSSYNYSDGAPKKTEKTYDNRMTASELAENAKALYNEHADWKLDSRTLDYWLSDNGYSGNSAVAMKAYLQSYGMKTSGRR